MYLVAWLRPVMPFIEYEINKKYIAEVLCENKDKPMMHCNGKCYLKKQLKKANDIPENEPLSSPSVINIRELITLLYERKLISLKQKSITKTVVTYIVNYQFLF
jgi:hypothetical protein